MLIRCLMKCLVKVSFSYALSERFVWFFSIIFVNVGCSKDALGFCLVLFGFLVLFLCIGL